MQRKSNRRSDELRPLNITYDILDYAAGSVLLELGRTKVLCAVTLAGTVPPFLRGKKTGWLSAQYAMLPTSTQIRTERESFSRYNGRFVEISRMIGRSLRTVIDLEKLGERSITVDCDVLQADGGTRTACITGSFLALKRAMARWVTDGEISESLLLTEIAGLSIGVMNETVLLDIDYSEDSNIDADFNFVLTRDGKIIEMQGAAEQKPVSWETFEKMRSLAQKGITDIFARIEQLDSTQPLSIEQSANTVHSKPKKVDNSLKARLAFKNQLNSL